MGNCLVTKLKGVVDNPNLPVLGRKILNVIPQEGWLEYRRLLVTPKENMTINLLDGLYFTNVDGTEQGESTKNLVAGTAYTLYISNGTGRIDLPQGPYNSLAFYGGGIQVTTDFLKYQNTDGLILEADKVASYEGNIDANEVVRFSPAKWIRIETKYGNRVIGDLPTLIGLVKSKNLTTLLVVATKVSGDLSVLDDPTLPLIDVSDSAVITGTINDLYYTSSKSVEETVKTIRGNGIVKLTGTVEAFVAKAIAAGETTGSRMIKYLYAWSNNVTMNNDQGEAIGLKQWGVDQSATNLMITWDAQGNITKNFT